MKLFIDKNLNINDQQKALLGKFCIFCADMLPIEGNFKICIVANRATYKISTTAVYILNQNCCYIYGRNRALPDIMRSVAHEMTHMMQDQTGLIIGKVRDAGGFHEDQANARAGELLKLFVNNDLKHKKVYENKLK